jgi:heme oxygenase
LWSPGSPALPALAKDLEHLATLGVEASVPPAAFELAHTIRQLSEKDPGALAGVVYVLEGSKLGGIFQAAALSKIPALHDRGRDYLVGTGARTRGVFRQFLTRLDAALETDAAPAVRGAVAAFEGFEAIVSAVSRAGTSSCISA